MSCSLTELCALLMEGQDEEDAGHCAFVRSFCGISIACSWTSAFCRCVVSSCMHRFPFHRTPYMHSTIRDQQPLFNHSRCNK